MNSRRIAHRVGRILLPVALVTLLSLATAPPSLADTPRVDPPPAPEAPAAVGADFTVGVASCTYRTIAAAPGDRPPVDAL